jgi:APA family basic amino acid/polyamine antiporter
MKSAGLADLLNAGPATIVSCSIAGVVILLCGLCFADLASLVPVAGGAFSYA